MTDRGRSGGAVAGPAGAAAVCARRRREVVDALRRGTVPASGLDLLAVGLDRFVPAFDAELDVVASGGAAFKAVRGEYGAGKTFLVRWLAERALRRGFAATEVQVSEAETPLHRLETVYRRVTEAVRTAAFPSSALRPVLDAWLYTLEADALAVDPTLGDLTLGDPTPGDPTAGARLDAAVSDLLDRRLAPVAGRAPVFAQVLRAYRAAVHAGDAATADGLVAWVGGQPHVAAAVKRAAGVRGELDHFGALGFLQGLLLVLRDAGHPGLLVVLDEVETLQRARGDVRDKALNALRQLIDEVDGGRFPGLYLVATGTPAFFDGPSGVPRLPPLASGWPLTSAPTPASTIPARFRSGCPGSPSSRWSRSAGGSATSTPPAPPTRTGCGHSSTTPTSPTSPRLQRVAGRAGRRCPPPVPEKARRRRLRPRRPVRRLRPAAALRADRARRGADRGRTGSPGHRARRPERALRRPGRRGPRPADRTGVTAGPEPGLHPAILYHVVNTLGWAALHPLQEAAVEPIAAGQDVLLLAPTAGGKTEAALFPVLSRIAAEDWRGLTVLYVCPLRALLNNLEPRVAGYASWLGRRAALWHGDTPTSARRRLRADRPDLLLTTPESLEAMLVSTLVTPREMFGDLRSVIVDEVHAFAGDDRGWHLLAVLERVSRVAGRPLQRVGLSATVGNRPNCRVGCRGRRAGTARPACSTRSPGTVVASTCNLTTSAPSGTRPRSSLRCTPARNGWPSPSPAAGSRNSPVDVVDQPVPAGEREYTRALDSPGQPRGVDGAHVLDPAPPGARPWGATDQPQVSVVVAVKLVDAVRQLNFAEMLPTDLARATLAARAADTLGAAAVAGRAIVAR